MTSDGKGDRLGRALELADAIRAAMPDPDPPRDQKVMLSLTGPEAERFRALAEERAEPVAVTARNLALAALQALGK